MDRIVQAIDFRVSAMEPHPSRNQWDLFVLQALDEKEQNQLQHHLDVCADCERVYGTIREEQKQWMNVDVPQTLITSWEQHATKQSHSNDVQSWWHAFSRWGRAAVWAPLGAFGMFLLLWGLEPSSLKTREPLLKGRLSSKHIVQGIRRKGSPSFFVYRYRNQTSRLVGPHSLLQGGDLLGFRYHSHGFRYMFVILLDQKQEISWLYPAQAGSSITIEERGRLKGSVELDNASGKERLLAFFSSQPLQSSEIKSFLRQPEQLTSGPLTLPHQPAQQIYLRVLTIRKK